MTEYIVLNFDSTADSGWKVWEEVHNGVEATSAENAIRRFVEANGFTSGEFVAIPKRSWKPVKVEVDTKPVVRINADSAE